MGDERDELLNKILKDLENTNRDMVQKHNNKIRAEYDHKKAKHREMMRLQAEAQELKNG
jgi:NTP pyrophosphatase (non-canonical NTP hydrolase)